VHTTRGETITLPDGERAGATLVLPEEGSGPGVLLLHEIFGVNEFVLAKADELARHGFAVLCPDVFHRLQPGLALSHDESSLAEGMTIAGRYFSETGEEQRLGDLLAGVARLRDLDEVTGKIAVMGYCFGGTLAYAAAARSDVDACVSYYGSGVPALLDAGERVSCPSLFHFGGRDPYLPFDHVVAIVEAYREQGNVEVVVQPGSGHAFENLLAPAFADPVAAARSWPVTLSFLDAELSV
jgi:carboxymethylenebutenolidase